MLDDLRNSALPFSEEEDAPGMGPSQKKKPGRREEGRFLGMTASQRFVIALLIFITVCVVGSFCLILTEKIVLPF